MIRRAMLKVHRDESGFALVTAMALLAVMSLLMIVVLSAGESVNRLSERGGRWTKLLGVAEAGLNDAVVHLSSDLSSGPADTGCPYDGTSTDGCTIPGGEYQVTWQRQNRGNLVITAYGFYPTAAAYLSGQSNAQARKVRMTMEPPQTFEYALFSATTLEIKNGATVIGDVFANEQVTVKNNATVCGSILNATLGIVVEQGARIVKSLSGSSCTSDANLHAGGPVTLGGTSVVQGNATASAPTELSCPPTPDGYYVSGGTVQGTATACGAVTTSTPNAQPYTKTAPPVTRSLPDFVFDEANYDPLTCFPAGITCDPATTSTTAVSSFNSTVSKVNMSGTYAIWQTNPSQSTKVSLEGLSLGGDLTIVTNAPIDLGNTGEVTTTASPGSLLVIVSLYVPPTGTTCSDQGGDCSIYGKNSVVLDSGDPDEPDDGVVALFYTTGKMAFKNQDNEGEGALWAGGMDLKNGFDVTYNAEVERVAGFGGSIEQTLWEELSP
ncbi:MAG: polymer-forming cytoskeletal protein [Actinobacteria bacterium]|nr:polymer-forming cytoskeletal protein [Actinomycetota bacterium]